MKIISRDSQGWPVYALTLRELLKELGFQRDGNCIFINSDSSMLDLYPVRVIDDGMGYGIDKQYFTEASTDNKSFITIFTEPYDEEAAKEIEEDYRKIEEEIAKKKINNQI